MKKQSDSDGMNARSTPRSAPGEYPEVSGATGARSTKGVGVAAVG